MSAKDHESYVYEFCDDTHSSEMLYALQEFYTRGLFTDITLCCSAGQMFHCHKAVLSARSSYFKVMFTLDMRERSNGIISLLGVDGDILSILVNYVYTSRVSITQANVQSLLEAADLLQFGSVKKACEEFLTRCLEVDNCLGMHSFAEHHVCPVLKHEALRIILGRFEELLCQEEFLGLDLKKLMTILSAENLNVWKQETLLEAVVKWVTFDIDSRRDSVHDLLHCVQFEVDDPYLRTALEIHKTCNDKKLRSVIFQSLKPCGKDLTLTSKKPLSNMYIIGGYYWHPLSEIHIWDPISNTWAQGKDIPDYTRESYGVSLLGSNIYVTGGYRAGAPAHETEFYDPLKKKWFPVAEMIQGVGNATACVVQDRIYVTGGHYGYRGSCTYDKIQTYRADINEWSIVTTTPHPEYGLCSVSLNNKLYLVGGQTTITDCYDPDRDEWRQLAVMKERRMECGAAVINGCVYVTGGYSYSKGTYLQNIERYDPELDCWEIVGNLPTATRSHGCVCVFNL
ncbi:kelch-like protein 23 isoform X2 [Hoplias malabaricus]|uniref:kelch-like protein 23 isoform X2 n=1 Tax=Hoplias malabaricus TaxID=27720 RepID=UPI0034620B34